MKRFFALSLIVLAASSFTACTSATSEADAAAKADSLAAALLEATTPAPAAGPVETTLTNDQIPQAIKDHLASTYPDYELLEAEKVEDAGTVSYEVEVNVNEMKKELHFDADGKFVSEKAEEASHDDHGHDH